MVDQSGGEFNFRRLSVAMLRRHGFTPAFASTPFKPDPVEFTPALSSDPV